MLFGLKNAPMYFIHLMNEMFKPFLESMAFLGHIVSDEGIIVKTQNIEVMKN